MLIKSKFHFQFFLKFLNSTSAVRAHLFRGLQLIVLIMSVFTNSNISVAKTPSSQVDLKSRKLQPKQATDLSLFKFPNIQLLPKEKYTPAPSMSPERLVNLTSQWGAPQVILSGFMNLYNARIIEEPGTDYPYRMYFFGWANKVCNLDFPKHSGCDAIFYGRSKNLIKWEILSGFDAKEKPLFDSSGNSTKWRPIIQAQNKFWDQWHNGDPTVIKVGKKYFMAYSSTGFHLDNEEDASPKDIDGDFTCIAGATSDDGIHWKKMNRPLLVAKDQIQFVDPVVNGMFHRPTMLFENGKFKLWFDYWAKDTGISTGYGELEVEPTMQAFENGIWTIKQGSEKPALANWPNPHILKTPIGYFMYGDPVGYGTHPWQGRKIAEAFSKDGVQWIVTGFIDTDPGCAATHVPSATLIGNEIYLTAGCQVGGEPYSPNYSRIHLRKRLLPAKPPVKIK